MVTANDTLIKRLPQKVSFREDITTYGADNLYPQRAEEVALRSPITKSSIKALAKFLGGEGFSENSDFVINRLGQTANDLIRFIRMDKATFDGWALHFNVNELGGITEIVPVKFKDLRFGMPDEHGRHKDVKLNINWERDFDSTIVKYDNIQTFPLWHRREDEDFEDIEGKDGFIYYWSPNMDEYPLVTFDSVMDSAQSNGEIQVFELSRIQQGFLGTSIFKHPGKFAGKKEKQQAINDLYNLTGPTNAGSVMLMEVPTDFDGQLIEQIPANNDDRLFELTNETSQSRIISNYQIPFSLLGIQPNGGMFNQEQMQDSYIYMNTMTREERQSISTAFNKFLQFWHTGAVNVGEIIESSFEVKTVETETVTETE
tara:strand:+ start:12763 stop:13878 length:1116 start_codon:yes stop_codon:yes gene_type:complete